jgi:hypothetical protein
MNRRGLFSAAVAGVLLPGAARAEGISVMEIPPVHPDAELLALAERFIASDLAIQAMDVLPDGNLDMAEVERLANAAHDLAFAMSDIRATTAAGIVARARCLAVHNAEGAFTMDGENTTAGRLAFDLIRDARALDGIPAGHVTSPDADLLAACAAFDALEREYLATGFGHEIGSPAEAVAEAEQERVSEAQRALVDRMCDLQAVTREGLAARAHSLALWDAELMKDGPGDIGECLTAAIVRDLLAGRPVA